ERRQLAHAHVLDALLRGIREAGSHHARHAEHDADFALRFELCAIAVIGLHAHRTIDIRNDVDLVERRVHAGVLSRFFVTSGTSRLYRPYARACDLPGPLQKADAAD